MIFCPITVSILVLELEIYRTYNNFLVITMQRQEHLAQFRPTETVRGFADIDLQAHRRAGKKLLILDAEGTFVNHHDWHVEPKNSEKIKESGFPYVVVATNNRPRDAETFVMINWWAHQINAAKAFTPQDKDEKKPGPYMLLAPMQFYGVLPEETLMVGDKLTKDIQAANLAGVESVWIQHHTGKADQPSDRYYRRIRERGIHWQQQWQELRRGGLLVPAQEGLVESGGVIVFEPVDPAHKINVPDWMPQVSDPLWDLWERSLIVNYGGRVRAVKYDWPPVEDSLTSPRLQKILDAMDERSLRRRERRNPGVNEKRYAEALKQLLAAAS